MKLLTEIVKFYKELKENKEDDILFYNFVTFKGRY